MTVDRPADSAPGAPGQPPHPEVGARESRQVAEAAREARWHKPSFAKQLFLGELRLDLVHPHPRPTEADRELGEAFLAELRSFCETSVDPAVIEREARIPDEVIRGLKPSGPLDRKIPERYGGLGLSQTYYNRAVSLLSSVSPALTTLVSGHQSIGVPQPVLLFGTEEQKERLLPRCVRGALSAFLLTEPDVGSDPARLQTTAVPTPDGSAYVLNGVKLWTTNSVVADLLVVMARVPKSEGHPGGISVFVVEAGSPGITVEARNAFMGLRGIENGVTRLHDVVVPAENLIGEEGRGLRIALTTLNTGRLALPAMCVATAKWCLKIAREWSSARVQWGRPIGQLEAISAKVGFIAATTFALEAVLELATAMADQGDNDIRMEAALAKLFCSEMAWRIADELVQIRGGRGYETAESLAARGERGVPVEQVLRDVRIYRIFEGSTEIMHLLIARDAVDAQLSAAGELISPEAALVDKLRALPKAGAFFARWLPQLVVGEGQRPSGFAEFRSLAAHLRFVERTSRKLARSTFYGMARWQGGLERKQLFLGRLVDVGAELFAMSACCVRAEMLRASGEDGALAVELADAFCRQATVRVEELFARLWRNTDDGDDELARRVLAGRYRSLEDGVLDPSLEGPWVADSTPGPSVRPNLHRRLD